MRFVPLVRSEDSPGPWKTFQAVELRWTGQLHAGWSGQIRQGQEVHAMHLGGEALDVVLDVLRAGLGPDFLVLMTSPPCGRLEASALLARLEMLLESTAGRGVRLALRCPPGEAGAVAQLLKEAGGDAVGFCWDGGVGLAVEAIADRIHCAVAGPGDDLSPLANLGYRWNVALEAAEPAAFLAQRELLSSRHPRLLFPPGLSAVSGDPGVRPGEAWGAKP